MKVWQRIALMTVMLSLADVIVSEIRGDLSTFDSRFLVFAVLVFIAMPED